MGLQKLDGTVHPFDLTVGSRMVELCKPVLNVVCFADHATLTASDADQRLRSMETLVHRQQSVPRERDHHGVFCFGKGRGVKGLRPVFRSLTVARLRHFATVLGMILSSRLSVASEACYRRIAAWTACVVVALPDVLVPYGFLPFPERIAPSNRGITPNARKGGQRLGSSLSESRGTDLSGALSPATGSIWDSLSR